MTVHRWHKPAGRFPAGTWGGWRAWCECGVEVRLPAGWDPEDVTILQCEGCQMEGGPIEVPQVDVWWIDRQMGLSLESWFTEQGPPQGGQDWSVPFDKRFACPVDGSSTRTIGSSVPSLAYSYRDCMYGHRIKVEKER